MLPFVFLTEPPAPNGLQGQRYERLGVIGSGGQGVVYRAFDHWTQRPVAIKVLNSAAAREPQMAERLNREQQALSALKGTAAVEVLDIYRGNDGELCLVMELLKGTNLDDHLQAIEVTNERIELVRVAEIFDPIVATLEVAHKAGIVHRDLKPANVFLLEDGGVRLLDFGMARLRKSAPLTAAGTVMGSPSFMAPEAWKGQSSLIDHRADVYSLGVILFRVLAGDLPFSGITLYEKMLGSTKAARPSLVAKRPDLPRDADEWVALALAIDPEQRFNNVRALWNAFLTTFDVEPPGKERPSFWAKATGTVMKIAGIPEAQPSGDPESNPSRSNPEMSFITQALARSVMQVSEPTLPAEPIPSSNAAAASSAEPTFEVLERTLEIVPKGSPAPAPLEKPAEKTVELSASNLIAVEPTLPDAARLETTAAASTPSQKKPVSSKKGANSKRRRRARRKK